MYELGCFGIYQVLAWQPDFDRNNLTRWVKKNYLVKLRQGYYAFSEHKSKPDFAMYISLHTASSFYGMIPEAVVQIREGVFASFPGKAATPIAASGNTLRRLSFSKIPVPRY